MAGKSSTKTCRPSGAGGWAIGGQLDLPTRSIAPDEAGAHFGWVAGFVGLDVRAASALTRERLGWRPTRPGLIADLEQGHYFLEGAR